MNRNDQRIVCVLGMFRTGSSLVAGILGRLGISFGRDELLLAANRANPTGFWENTKFIELNDALLARLHGAWYDPPAPPAGWEADESVADLGRAARSLIEAEFGSVPSWGWKDPRTCLTLPFWRQTVPAARYVLCVRNPMDAAASLVGLPWGRRWLEPPSVGRALDLWVEYTRRAFEETRDRPSLVVFYEDVLFDWRREASRLAEFVDVTAPTDGGAEQAIAAYVQPALRHHAAAASNGPPLSNHPAIDLYSELRTARR